MPPKEAVPGGAKVLARPGNSNPVPERAPEGMAKRPRPPAGAMAEGRQDAAIAAAEDGDPMVRLRRRAARPSRYDESLKDDEAFEGVDAESPAADANGDDDDGDAEESVAVRLQLRRPAAAAQRACGTLPARSRRLWTRCAL